MQYLASLAIASLSAALFLLVADVFIVDLPARPLIPVFIRYLIVCAIFMFGGMVTSALPLTFQAAGSIFSICLTLIVVFGLASEAGDGPPHHWIQYFNVFAIARQFLVGGSQPDGIWVAIWLYTVACIVLGIYGFKHFRMNPEWSNR
ncbi:hypothetical protein H0A71_19945 [Alcaligenaceae bacterium]|nr:hypothetical protein [Alcaligenaceae bacterium]